MFGKVTKEPGSHDTMMFAGWPSGKAMSILLWFEEINDRPEYEQARDEFMAAIAKVDSMTKVERAKAEILRLQRIVDEAAS